MRKRMNEKRKKQFFEVIFFFLVGCFFGYVFETILCLIQFGKYESRKGLIYGPFNVIYGLAFAVAPLLLRRKKGLKLFLFSTLYGGLFEYLCSWFQETFLGTISWDYHDQILNFDGRTSFRMMLLWGAIGFLFMKFVVPFLEKVVEKIKPTLYVPLALIISIFFLFDILISALAMIREQERLKHHEPYTFIGEWIDKTYPSSVLDEIFPHRMKPETLKELRTNQELHQASSSPKSQ